MRVLDQKGVIARAIEYAVTGNVRVMLTTCVLAAIWAAVAVLGGQKPGVPTASDQRDNIPPAMTLVPVTASGITRDSPAIPKISQSGPQPNSEVTTSQSAYPQESSQVLRVPNASPGANWRPFYLAPSTEALRTTSEEEPELPAGNASQVLPASAPIHVLVNYAQRGAAAKQKAVELVRQLRSGGLAVSGPAPAVRVSEKAGITYFFAEDHDAATRVEHDLGGKFGSSRLTQTPINKPLRRPGTIMVMVTAEEPP